MVDLHEPQPVDPLHLLKQSAEGLEVDLARSGPVAEEIFTTADDGGETG